MKISVTFLVVWTALNIALTAWIVLRTDNSESSTEITSTEVSNDTRTAVLLPVKARDAALAEMRQMLASVQGVMDGVSRSDIEAIRTAAKASGVGGAVDPELKKILPPAFLQMGMKAHQGFDELAANADEGPEAALERLVTITATCVACHATYRLETK